MEYLLIGGAAKSGTTYLFDYLSSHEEVIPSSPKETFFFIDKENPLLNNQQNCHISPVSAFTSFFPTSYSTCRYFLEGTSHLLYQQEVVGHIRELGKCRLIFILREPARRILSSFHFTKYNLGNFKTDVAFADYAQALLQGDSESIISWIRPSTSQYVLPKELAYGHYFRFLEKWEKELGAEQIQVLQFERLLANKPQQMGQLCEWLGVNLADFSPKGVERNPSYFINHPTFHHYLQKINRKIPANRLKGWLKQVYFAGQARRDIPPLSDDDLRMLEQLKKHFEGSNHQLEQRYGVDLNLWA